MKNIISTLLIFFILPFALFAQYSGGNGRGGFSASLNGKHLTNWFNTAGNWSMPGNWMDGVVPSSSDGACIAAAAILDGDYTYQDLTIAEAGSVTIPSGKSLTVPGVLTNDGGFTGLVLKSDATGTGSLMTSSCSSGTVERYFPGASQAWHFLSAPVYDQAISPDFTNIEPTYYDIFAWYEPSGVWVNYKNNTIEPTWNTANGGGNFQSLRGYLVEYLGTNLTKQFKGTICGGSHWTHLSRIGTGTYSGYNLIGNPFTSAIDWKAASGWTRNDLVTNSGGYDMSIWNDADGNYGTFNSAGSTGTHGVTRYIPVGQGFMVKTSINDGLIMMDPGIRIHDNQAFLKSATEIENTLRMKVSGDANAYTDEIVIEFGHQNPIGGAEKMFSFYETAPSLFTAKSSGNYSVDFRGEPGAVSIPVSFKAGADGNYTINASQLESFATATIINLEDLQLARTQNLMQNPLYAFTANANDEVARFVLHFGGAFDVNDQEKEVLISIYASGNSIYIAGTPGTLLKGQAVVYNMIGQPLIHRLLTENQPTKINLTGSTGYYLVKVITNDNTLTGKVFIHNN